MTAQAGLLHQSFPPQSPSTHAPFVTAPQIARCYQSCTSTSVSGRPATPREPRVRRATEAARDGGQSCRAVTLAATVGGMVNASFETPLPLVSNSSYTAQRIDDRSLHARPSPCGSVAKKGPSWLRRIQSLARGTYPLIRAIAALYPPWSSSLSLEYANSSAPAVFHCCACS